MCIVRYSIDRAERDPYLNVEIVPGNYEFAIHMTVNGKELGVEGIIKVEGVDEKIMETLEPDSFLRVDTG